MPMIKSELFTNLSISALDVLAGRASEKTFAAYDAVFQEGQEAEYVYVLIEGAVHLTMGDAEELCFTVENGGETFGWSALLEPYRYRATARCMTAVRVFAIPRTVIIDIGKTCPQDGITIFKNLATILIERLRNAYQEVLNEPDLEGIASATVDRTLLRRG